MTAIVFNTYRVSYDTGSSEMIFKKLVQETIKSSIQEVLQGSQGMAVLIGWEKACVVWPLGHTE